MAISRTASVVSDSSSHYFGAASGQPQSRARTISSWPRTRTAASTAGNRVSQDIVAALIESRGVSPTVGLAFVNLSTTEAILCQIVDGHSYVKTLHKLLVYEPSVLIVPTTAVVQPLSKLVVALETNLDPDTIVETMPRKYWDETVGLELLQQFAFREEVEAMKVILGGNNLATCSFAAALQFMQLQMQTSFSRHSMRIKFEPSEGTMMIDMSTVKALELVQSLYHVRSEACLMGLLNETLTPMGARLLRNNILQPSTERETLNRRYDALENLIANPVMAAAIREALSAFLDVDRDLTRLVTVPKQPGPDHWQQSVNNVLRIKQYIKSIPPVWIALEAASCELLSSIREFCNPNLIAQAQQALEDVINDDVTFQQRPLELRNQRTYAVKSGSNGLLDVARQTYKEAVQDIFAHADELKQRFEISLDVKYDAQRQFYLSVPIKNLANGAIPAPFINIVRKRQVLQCQTLDMIKLSQRVTDAHHEVLQMSDVCIQALIERLREQVAPLFRVSDSIALLDMLSGLAQVALHRSYSRPELLSTMAIKAGRHPLLENLQDRCFVPNDVYAAPRTRMQIITGCNMSGKSTYIRSVALMTIMAQIGSFVPASYAAIPIRHQLFARIAVDDNGASNVSTFAAEMREMAFILNHVDVRSLVIVDELGRGTSTRDGLAIATAIAEALVESRAFVWFVTHFQELAVFLSERPGVSNYHLSAKVKDRSQMTMLYRLAAGPVQEESYGIALARVAGLPHAIIDVAEQSVVVIRESQDRRHGVSRDVLQARRQRLVLALREQLQHVRDIDLPVEALRRWLKQLQDEFVARMGALADEEQAVLEGRLVVDGQPTAPADIVEPIPLHPRSSRLLDMETFAASGDGSSVMIDYTLSMTEDGMLVVEEGSSGESMSRKATCHSQPSSLMPTSHLNNGDGGSVDYMGSLVGSKMPHHAREDYVMHGAL